MRSFFAKLADARRRLRPQPAAAPAPAPPKTPARPADAWTRAARIPFAMGGTWRPRG